eukprot:gene5308-5344_t
MEWYDEGDVEAMLAEQGMHPWDDDADAVMDVLTGGHHGRFRRHGGYYPPTGYLDSEEESEPDREPVRRPRVQLATRSARSSCGHAALRGKRERLAPPPDSKRARPAGSPA